MKKILIAFALGLVALPAAAVVTFLLHPFWGWFEAKTGIESLGHSGPADWCFALVYVLVLLLGLGVWFSARRKSPAGH